MKKKNNNSEYFKDWTTSKLKSEAKSYHSLIYGQQPCYGSRDIMAYDGILQELYNRGIEPTNSINF